VVHESVALFRDVADLHINLLSVTSAKILTAAVPFYVTTRLVDHDVHKNFYDSACHKNINQVNEHACNAVEKGAFVGVVACSSLAFLASDEELRITSRIFMLGAITGLWAKNVIKHGQFHGGLRPWNEHFSSEKQSCGGFPSGHMFEASYMLTVYGLEYGRKAAIPLGLFAAAMFGVSISCNRHYVSQLVAGTAFGALYGFAAHKTIQKRLAERCSLDFCMANGGAPAVRLSWNF
jgi:hypothetical protein